MEKGPRIETERLVLRRWDEADLETFAQLNSDPVVMEFFPAMLSREESDAFARRIEASFDECGYGLFALEVTRGARFAGFVGLHSLAGAAMPFAADVEVGWRLARSAWGKGYATEAAEAVLAFGFRECEMTEIVSFTSQVNVRSKRVMQKIGMHRDPAEDFLHPRVEAGHVLSPHVLYRLTASEWETGGGS